MGVTPEMARIARGATWSGAGVLATQVLGLLTSILTARALPPDAFGVVGMALVVTALLSAVIDGGMAPAIASGRVSDERTVFTAHWIICGGALVAGVIVAAVAPLVGAFFGAPLVATVLRVQVIATLCGAAIIVPTALLQRTGRFAALAALTVSRQVLILAGVVAAVALRAGVWTLVIPGVVAAVVLIPAYWLVLGRAPPVRLRGARPMPLVREGFHVSGSGLSSYLARNADNLIIGKLNGEHALGLYAVSYNFLIQPLGLFSHALIPVLLPAFGRLEHGEVRSDGAVRVTTTLARIGWPFMVGGALTAPLFVPLLLGSKWGEAVVLVQLMMIIGALQIPGPIFGTMALAIGDTRFVFCWSLAAAITAIAAFLVGALVAGPVGVAAAYLLHTAALLCAMYAIARRRFRLPLRGLPSGLLRVARDVGLMAAAVLLTGVAARALGSSPGLVLCAEVGVGAVAYVLAVRLLSPDQASLLLSLLPPRIARASARAMMIALPRAREQSRGGRWDHFA